MRSLVIDKIKSICFEIISICLVLLLILFKPSLLDINESETYCECK